MRPGGLTASSIRRGLAAVVALLLITAWSLAVTDARASSVPRPVSSPVADAPSGDVTVPVAGEPAVSDAPAPAPVPAPADTQPAPEPAPSAEPAPAPSAEPAAEAPAPPVPDDPAPEVDAGGAQVEDDAPAPSAASDEPDDGEAAADLTARISQAPTAQPTPSPTPAAEQQDPGVVTICHPVAGAGSRYVEIAVLPSELDRYSEARGDIIPAPAGGCPSRAPGDTSGGGSGGGSEPSSGGGGSGGGGSQDSDEEPSQPAPSRDEDDDSDEQATGQDDDAASESRGAGAQSPEPAPAAAEPEPAVVAPAAPAPVPIASVTAGALPLTGFAAWLLAAAGIVFLLAGLAIRRLSRTLPIHTRARAGDVRPRAGDVRERPSGPPIGGPDGRSVLAGRTLPRSSYLPAVSSLPKPLARRRGEPRIASGP